MFNFTYLKTKLCKWGLLIHVYALMQKSLNGDDIKLWKQIYAK